MLFSHVILLLKDVIEGLSSAATWVGIWLASGMYKVAMGIFKLFLILTKGQLINAKDLETMIGNFYVIIGVVMLFVIAFFLLKTMINPDDQNKSSTSIKKIIMNTITSIVILSVLPTVFSFMFDVQDSIVNYNVFGKFFGLGSTSATTEDITSGDSYEIVSKQSYRLVNGVFTAFFNVDVDTFEGTSVSSSSDLGDLQAQIHINENATEIDGKYTSFQSAINYVNDTGKITTYAKFTDAASFEDDDGHKLEFDFLMCLIAGFVICWVGISYCFDMAVRLVKLVFYQLIAPVPVLLRIVPEGKLSGIFNQWLKITFTCYFEVFVRLFVFYFVIFMTDRMTQPGTFLGEDLWKYGAPLALLAHVITFLGMMLFMKQAPKLISEVTGFDSGNMKLGIMDKIKDSGIYNLASAGLGFAGGMIAGRDGKKLNLLAGFRAGYHGWKQGNLQGIGSEVTRRRELQEAKANGATWSDRMTERARRWTGLNSSVDEMNRQTEEYKLYDDKGKIKGNMEAVNDTGIEIGLLDSNGNVKKTLISDGAKFTYTKESVEELNKMNADNQLEKSKITEQNRILNERQTQNESLIGSKGNLEAIAEKEMNKNKFRLKDKDGNDLSLSYHKLNADGSYATDSSGKYVYETIDFGTQAQFAEWFEVHKERMSSDDLRDLTDTYKKSLAVWSKEAFINSNGREGKRDDTGALIYDINGNLELTDANKDIQKVKRDIAFNIQQYGFVNADGSSKVFTDALGNNIDVYEHIINKLSAAGVNTNDPNFELSEHIDINIVKELKDKGEDLNFGDIADQIRVNKQTKEKFDAQAQAVSRMLNQVKEQQDAQKHSKRYKAATASSNYDKNIKK